MRSLTLGVTAVTGWIVARTPVSTNQASPTVFVLVAVIGTALFLWTASSAAALSVGAGSLVSGLQSWLLARDARRRDEGDHA